MDVIVADAVNGIDISSAQGKVDFRAVKAAGFEYVYIQSSRYSSTRDLPFDRYVQEAHDAGLWTGAYHFCSHDTSPEKQAEFFYKASSGLGSTPGELPPLADWEFCTPAKYQDHPRHCVDWIERFTGRCDELWGPSWRMWQLDRATAVYTYPVYSGGHQPVLSKSTKLAGRPLVYASYKPGKWLPQSWEDVPVHAVPLPWSIATIVQYSGNGGLPVPGVAGSCDRQVFCGTGADWDKFRGIKRPVDSIVKDDK